MPQQLPLLSEDRPTYTTQRDETERAATIERLREQLADPAFRAIESFPIGDDEAILALSDPPYYTAGTFSKARANASLAPSPDCGLALRALPSPPNQRPRRRSTTPSTTSSPTRPSARTSTTPT